MAHMKTCNRARRASSMHHFVVLFSLLFVASAWTPRALAVNVFVAGLYNDDNDIISRVTMKLTTKQYLNISNFYLVMQSSDCTLVIYNGSVPFLTSDYGIHAPQGNHSSGWDCYAALLADGNFVVYQPINATYSRPIWSTGTQTVGYKNSTYRYLMLEGDGSLSMHNPDGTDLNLYRPLIPANASRAGAPSPAPVPSSQNTSTSNFAANSFPAELAWKPEISLDGYPYMPAEYFLSQGSRLQTIDGRFTLMLGRDCKLQSQEMSTGNNSVKRVIWDPQRSMSGVVPGTCQLMLQQDGLLEVRDNVSGVAYWNSSVSKDDTVNWVLKVNADDGHVSVSDILDATNILWTSAESLLPQEVAMVWPIVVGVIGGVLIVGMVAFVFWYLYLRPRFYDPDEKAFKRRLQSIGGKCNVLSQAKIKRATNQFGNKIGYGGFGDVFYGKLPDGKEIAVKVLSAGSHQSKHEFYNEVELLSGVHHKHLVALLGYSSTWKQKILIYEYMGGGDLRDRLQGKSAVKNPLNWKQRISITLQVAEGLEYLHDKCSPGIIHRDVKSNNILLTNKLVAKVADFGLSKLRTVDQEMATHITTAVKGTPGYLDPEYHETGMLTEKSDVYAFGIVLMEILTGKYQMSISQLVSEARRLGQYEDLVDPNLGGDFDKDEFVSLVELSLWCARKNNLERPFMSEVVQMLRELLNPEHVMTFGTDFVHSDVDSNGTIASFSKFPSSCISNFEVSGFVRDFKISE